LCLIYDSKLDVSQRVLVPQEWFTPLHDAHEERINLRLFLGHELRRRWRENRRRCFTKFLELMKMSVQFQKPLVLLQWQARHQRGSRCARAGQVSGYYGVAMPLD
jgi:hypothetical protein